MESTAYTTVPTQEPKEHPESDGSEHEVIVAQPARHSVELQDMTASARQVRGPVSGLDVLASVDQLLVMHKIEALEVISGFEGRNKYTIKNKQGNNLCYAVEQSSCISRLFCGALRHFDMKITMWVTAPPGTVVGRIEQDWSLMVPRLRVLDSGGNIMTHDGSKQVGRICKTWSGLAKELFSDADHFGINFPLDIDVKMKAVLLGACFLIDFMYFEKFYKK
ncbi:hypothetical protein B566_EDAN010093 [Ephemera danica]|nr:hypothetical protein B566_EDAN010093 [Ephemera danica]